MNITSYKLHLLLSQLAYAFLALFHKNAIRQDRGCCMLLIKLSINDHGFLFMSVVYTNYPKFINPVWGKLYKV